MEILDSKKIAEQQASLADNVSSLLHADAHGSLVNASADGDNRGHTAHAGDETEVESKPKFQPHTAIPSVHGIDVSEFQGNIDWKKVQQTGVDFAYVRATDGTTIQDKKFSQNWEDAKQAGVLVGAYHYFTTTSPVSTQIENFSSEIGKVSDSDLPPVIDVEDPHQFKRFTVKQRVDMVQQMLDGVEKATGEKPLLYMSSSFSAGELGGAPQFDKYKLWVADYRSGSPTVPKPWTEWDFWQHSKKGKVNGIKGNVDLDYYGGSADQLKQEKST